MPNEEDIPFRCNACAWEWSAHPRTIICPECCAPRSELLAGAQVGDRMPNLKVDSALYDAYVKATTDVGGQPEPRENFECNEEVSELIRNLQILKTERDSEPPPC